MTPLTNPRYLRRIEGSCITPLGRFMAKVNQAGDCWEWEGARSPKGYGLFNAGRTVDGIRRKGRCEQAQRVIYGWTGQPIPTGWHIDHLCRNKGCVNPAHLEAVPAGENTRRTYAHRTCRLVCQKGHWYPPTTKLVWGGERQHRRCPTCRRVTDERKQLRRRHGI